MSLDELDEALSGVREAYARLAAATEELRIAQAELEGAEGLALARLCVVVARGELDPTLLYRLYWSTEGLRPGQIAEAVGVRPEQLFKSVGPFVVEVACRRCGGPTTVSFISRRALDERRQTGDRLCNECEEDRPTLGGR